MQASAPDGDLSPFPTLNLCEIHETLGQKPLESGWALLCCCLPLASRELWRRRYVKGLEFDDFSGCTALLSLSLGVAAILRFAFGLFRLTD